MLLKVRLPEVSLLPSRLWLVSIGPPLAAWQQRLALLVLNVQTSCPGKSRSEAHEFSMSGMIWNLNAWSVGCLNTPLYVYSSKNHSNSSAVLNMNHCGKVPRQKKWQSLAPAEAWRLPQTCDWGSTFGVEMDMNQLQDVQHTPIMIRIGQ